MMEGENTTDLKDNENKPLNPPKQDEDDFEIDEIGKVADKLEKVEIKDTTSTEEKVGENGKNLLILLSIY